MREVLKNATEMALCKRRAGQLMAMNVHNEEFAREKGCRHVLGFILP